MPRKRLSAPDAPQTRKTRGAETRQATARKAEQRAMPATHYESELHIPEHVIPAGMVYAWVRISTLNEADPRNWSRRQRGGWKPVPRDRHPDIFPIFNLPGMKSDDYDNIIVNGGLVLCEKPKAMVKAARDKLHAENTDALQSVRWTGTDEFDKSIPAKDFGSGVGIERVTSQPAPVDEFTP